jgi:c-di-GMP-related signal transduction protein
VDVFLARHAIFDRNISLFGYELLFRSCVSETANVTDDTSSTLQVLANSLLSSGLHTVCCNAPVFINFGKEMLTSQWTSLFPPQSVVIEILETVEPDQDVIEACGKLREMGYLMALDDIRDEHTASRLVELATFVKVDFRQTSKELQRKLAEKYHATGKYLLAEKVETHDEFQWAYEAGYDYFQGFFFAKPALLKGRHLPNVKVNALRLLTEGQKEELNFQRLENIIRCDVSLSYKLFRYANAALFARAKPVSTVRDALVAMGELDIRRWITLATLGELGAGAIRELVVHALVRARFCETMATAAGLLRAGDAFLVGMFSLLDALVNRPLGEVLAELALPEHISSALLREDDKSKIGAIYRIALQYEAGEWGEVTSLVRPLGLSKQLIPGIYLEAIRWSNETFKVVGQDLAAAGGRDAKQPRVPGASDLLAMRRAVRPQKRVVVMETESEGNPKRMQPVG